MAATGGHVWYMYKGNSIGVVVPAYNESGLVGEVIETLPSFVDRAYVVDDRSTDDTWIEITKTAAMENDSRDRATLADGGVGKRRVVPLRHDRNRGVGGAIKTGYLAARDEGLDVVAVMGGDGQMDPDILDRILDPVVTDRADYAKGNRLLHAGDRAGMPPHRVVGNYLLTLLTRIVAGYWTIGDPQNGYAAISREAIDAADADDMYEYYGYCNDLLVKLNVADARVADVPMVAKYDEETSHIRLSSYVPRVSAMLARNYLWRLYAKYVTRGSMVVPACYAAGFLGGGAGVLSVAAALADLGGVTATVGATVFLLGAGSFLGAAALDRATNRHLDFVATP